MEYENQVQNRADNFTEDEIEILIQDATQRRETIHAKLRGNLTKLRKQVEWKIIATTVSAVSGINRTWKEIVHKLETCQITSFQFYFTLPNTSWH